MHIRPAWRRRQQRTTEQQTTARRSFLTQWLHAAQIDRLNTLGQTETGALFAVAHAVDRRIHRQHQRLITRRLGAPDQRLRKDPIRLDIQLKPQRGVRLLSHRFKRYAGLGTQHHAGLHRRGSEHRGQLALGMHQLLIGHRRKENRVSKGLPKQLQMGIAAAEVSQHPRAQANALKRRLVLRQGQLIGRTAGDIGPGLGTHALACQWLIVRDGGNAGRNLRQFW